MKVFYNQFHTPEEAQAWINIILPPNDIISIYERSGYMKPIFVWYRSLMQL